MLVVDRFSEIAVYSCSKRFRIILRKIPVMESLCTKAAFATEILVKKVALCNWRHIVCNYQNILKTFSTFSLRVIGDFKFSLCVLIDYELVFDYRVNWTNSKFIRSIELFLLSNLHYFFVHAVFWYINIYSFNSCFDILLSKKLKTDKLGCTSFII